MQTIAELERRISAALQRIGDGIESLAAPPPAATPAAPPKDEATALADSAAIAVDQAGKAAFVLHWKSLRRQIRIEGSVAPVDAATADAYFATRSRDSQLGAWASDQSRPLAQAWSPPRWSLLWHHRPP